jgi:hypothetical protein
VTQYSIWSSAEELGTQRQHICSILMPAQKTACVIQVETDNVLLSLLTVVQVFSNNSQIFHFKRMKVQWNLYLPFPDNSFSRICRSISMVPEQILFQLWLLHLLFSRIHCFFFRPPTKMMNRGFTVYPFMSTGTWCYNGCIFLPYLSKFKFGTNAVSTILCQLSVWFHDHVENDDTFKTWLWFK